MILVDTSIWVEHLRRGNQRLTRMLEQGQVLAHPYVTGEVALGKLRNRDTILRALQNLPATTVATDDEVLRFIHQNSLYGVGIGYIDAHLLAAVRLSSAASLWTADKRLLAAARSLGLADDERR
ncbi:PIN domain-containing protein [Accumulibacter sp.]|uniref:type II toxin-antitoxin system VapC family toxin n=1 Tax=Accumulibacter sp. TaxID=2053492 RepID=UPI001DE7B7C9|nr:PIN domain-containing protein [Accumulibacter sp.]MCB1931792.1 PIN domain-containing protein [Accumulibacter sp.]MCB1967701.1 PIN domain-containing protein [Accumulibacter sp.]MCP5227705.1 PIN domain-containing protein [Accumulibacter sp.]